MINAKLLKHLLFLNVFFVAFLGLKAQENVGMATGNYAGISGIWMNPANAVDSRYKFDINIIGVNSYFNNNYLYVKNGAIARRLFSKTPYNSSFADVKNDLLQEGAVNGRVYARTENNIHLPLSFLITTGPKSAIAFTMNNRTVNALSGLNPSTAKMFFDELKNPDLYNVAMNNDSLRYNFLNWQEVGLTYGRVLIGKGSIFLKAAVTAKWLGAGAAGFLQADNATLAFKNDHTLSLNSPLIKYGRTSTADIGAFSRKSLFNNLEDQSWGMDAGIVFEWRANINKFKYTDQDANTLLRKDKNKYILRLGISVVDIGGFTFTRKPLTNNHSANIVDWDFSGVKANNFSDFDTAYSKKVNYVSGSPSTFTYRLPGAAIINADLHLFGGFYINVAAKQPLAGYGAKANTYIEADRWTVITPRFEGSFLGIYVPVTRAYNQTNVGLTVKFGPFYVGSNNLAQIFTNDKSMSVDLHAGFRISILQGKPKIFNSFENISGRFSSKNNETQKRLDSLAIDLAVVKKLEEHYQGQKPVTIIIYNDGSKSDVIKQNGDSVVINNKAVYPGGNAKTNQSDSASEYYIRQLAARQLEVKKLQQQLDEQKSGKKAKKLKRSNDDEMQESNEMLQDEIEKIKQQNRNQNAAIITAAATTSLVSNAGKKGIIDSSKSNPAKDTIYNKVVIVPANVTAVKDTIKIIDTLYVNAIGAEKKTPYNDTLYFAINSTTLTGPGVNKVKSIALLVKNQSQFSIHLIGHTDATGTPAINSKIASGRVSTVREILLKEGIEDKRIKFDTKLNSESVDNAGMLRRVDIIVSDDK